ncbi:MAG: hypothetical protein H2076_00065 [Planctomycetes bacterium]|nr:hypothetical protein [Planctomycetota bacterium]
MTNMTLLTNSSMINRFFGSRLRSNLSIFLLSLTTACILQHSFDQLRLNPIQEMYQKIDQLPLEDSQRVALRAIRNLYVEESALETGSEITSDFLLSVSGILTEDQFLEVSGKAKDERQKLRYELRQIRAEMALGAEGILPPHR